ncbi:MAG: CpsD/CapB family tyrosine-protein kinase [Chloroflexi bacterium]|nr:CpsD/CapB family tyrosine-protein kinase [Chloroflexota bacterium]
MVTTASALQVGALAGYGTAATTAATSPSALALPAGWEEMWRQVYTPLLFHSQPEQTKLLAVASALDGEGKTTTALGLALTIAADLDVNVLLLDCNLINPSLSESVGAEEAPGVADWLRLNGHAPGHTALEYVTRRTALRNLSVVPCGRRVSNPSKLIRSASTADLLQTVRSKFDIAIMDTPSLLSSSDARVLVSCADAALLVVRAGVSTTHSVAKALSMMEGVANRAIVVNDFSTCIPKSLQQFFVS